MSKRASIGSAPNRRPSLTSEGSVTGTWYRNDLGDEVAASEPVRALRAAFQLAYITAPEPTKLAIFTYHHPRTHRVTAYFCPAAAILAQRFGAIPCERPIQDKNLRLVAGHADSFVIRFAAASSPHR